MRTLNLAVSIFSTLMTLVAALLVVRRVILALDAGQTADQQIMVLAAILALTSFFAARTLRTAKDD